jgi:hypothetical protein
MALALYPPLGMKPRLAEEALTLSVAMKTEKWESFYLRCLPKKKCSL